MADTTMSRSSSPCDSLMFQEGEDYFVKDKVVPTCEPVPVVNDSPKCVIFVNEEHTPGLESEKSGTLSQELADNTQSDSARSWSELTCRQKAHRVVVSYIGRPLIVLTLLYFFICSLDLLSSAFRLVGGKAAGNAFSSSVLVQNPVAGLMLGIISTVLVQSSSTSTSIVVAMVSSGILGVRPAVPIIMGANIGTSVTNTIVSLAQSTDRGQFELAFAGATVHDMFNWLAVILLLPLEIATGFLFRLTQLLVDRCEFQSHEGANKDILKAITKPLTNLVIQLDKNVIKKLALGHTEYQNKTLLKEWCKYEEILVPASENITDDLMNNTTDLVFINGTAFVTEKDPVEQCQYLFRLIPLNDLFLGLLLMAISLTLLCTCLVFVVKTLNSTLKGPVSTAAKKIINKDLPGKCAYFTGYLAIIAGAGLTIVVQSSSVFTSTLTPLVGMNVITLERMYPLTLGSNIGTTTTGLLAAMAASGDKLQAALQIALVHLFFNISAILVFYPVPYMRWPIPLAKAMGRTTAKYRWFAILYLICMFFLLPGCLFALSVAGTIPFIVTSTILLAFCLFLIIVNVMKKKYAARLSPGARKFVECLPNIFYSLEPIDNVLQCITRTLKAAFHCCCCCKKQDDKPSFGSDEPMLGPDDSLNSSDPSIRKNNSFFDRMTEEERIEYESTVRSLEEVKVRLTAVKEDPTGAAGTDSGYVTQINTPYLSKFPSREDFSHL